MGEESTDDCSDARSDNRFDFDFLLCKTFQNAEMDESFRSTASEGQVYSVRKFFSAGLLRRDAFQNWAIGHWGAGVFKKKQASMVVNDHEHYLIVKGLARTVGERGPSTSPGQSFVSGILEYVASH